MKSQGGRRRLSMSRILSIFARTVVCGLFLLFAVTTASAQFRASIQGIVRDTSGAVIPEATVTVTNKETSKQQQVTASSEGFYRVSGLAPGTYTVSAEKAGYKKKMLESVTVSAEATEGVDITLDVGDVTAVVTVAQEATSLF